MKKIDLPKAVRKGEELDLEKLRQYMAGQRAEWDVDMEVSQFPSGFSNLTYCLTLGEKEMVLRRPPFGANIKSGHDMHREYKVMKHLKDNFGKVPEVYAYSDDLSIMDAPFYLMERVKGVIVRRAAKLKISAAEYEQISESWLDTLVELHACDYKAAGLGDLGNPEGYVARQIQGWSRRYYRSKTNEVKEIEKVMLWLNAHIPMDSDATLIHNDYKYDNVVFDPNDWTKIKAVLDWEMTTIGDPLMDLGTYLAYWVTDTDMDFERMFSSLTTNDAGNPTREEVVQKYAKKSGRQIDDFIFYYVYGLFKVTVIAQQIYYRFNQGLTKDPRFGALNEVARMLCVKALQAIAKKKLDNLF